MERPILFSTSMVQAILDGRKTQTKRVMKGFELSHPSGSYPAKWIYSVYQQPIKGGIDEERLTDGIGRVVTVKCPYGRPGDILWVRETHYAWGHWSLTATYGQNSVTKKWKFQNLTLHEGKIYHYEDNPPEKVIYGRFGIGWYKRPSIFMPKEACRAKLLIKNIRVERLQQISYADAISEGVESSNEFNSTEGYLHQFKNYQGNDFDCDSIGSYLSLWESINGEGSWYDNPWVWVIEFENIKME